MKKIFYEKIGRKYVPVAEYDSDYLDSFPQGNHLVMCYPGGSSRRYRIDPAYAPLIAASRVAEDAMSTALVKASEIRLRNQDRKTPLTPSQKAAWENLVNEFGESARQLEWASARDVAEAGIKALQDEADRLLENPSVRKAYERFLLVAELTKDTKNENTN